LALQLIAFISSTLSEAKPWNSLQVGWFREAFLWGLCR